MTTLAPEVPPTAPPPAVPPAPWPVYDLFSGAGGMSCGFARHPGFRVVAAADAEMGKPSTGFGALHCNRTFETNLGVAPAAVDLGVVSGAGLRAALGAGTRVPGPVVLSACPPCTGFSRARAGNHVVDDPRNSLVVKVVEFVAELRPAVVVMENARELITGNFRRHYDALRGGLEELGYAVDGAVHMLTRFGLPQARERALVVAAAPGVTLRTLDDLWDGYAVRPEATTVRRAIGHLPPVGQAAAHPDDPAHVATGVRDPVARRRLAAMPHDGGSWADLLDRPDADELLTGGMKRAVARRRLNQFCDIYGRMAWDRPAPTIKRECAHVGNGRYAHPEQDRLCTVREMALLQGFPRDYRFVSASRKNMYRHVGDAVPPLVSYQIAALCAWMLTGVRPAIEAAIMPGTHLRADDVTAAVTPAPDLTLPDLFETAGLEPACA